MDDGARLGRCQRAARLMFTFTGRVVSVDYVSAKDGRPAWQIVTDYAQRDADGLCRAAAWVRHSGPAPAIAEQVTIGLHPVWWGKPETKVGKIDVTFDPNDPRLFTG